MNYRFHAKTNFASGLKQTFYNKFVVAVGSKWFLASVASPFE